ncbi:MAG TPA: helix-turn-helix transcriptional regulator [Gemmatimonadales bacterium]
MSPAPISARFGIVLRRHREAAGLSQRQLSAITGHQRTHIGHIEQGIGNPTLTLADDLACALGTSLGEMLLEAQRLRGSGIGGPLEPGGRPGPKIAMSQAKAARPLSVYPNFGVVLRKHRHAAGLSQRALADLAGRDMIQIGAIEQGFRNTTLAFADDLARALKTSVAKMILAAEKLAG